MDVLRYGGGGISLSVDPFARHGSAFPQLATPLADIAVHLGTMQEATDLRELFAGLARSVVQALTCEACVISLWDQERDVIYDFAASSVPSYRLNTVVEEFRLSDFPETKAVMETGRPLEISVSDPTADKRERKYLRELGAERVLITRLTVEGRGIGTVEAYRLHDRPFRKDDPRQVDLLVSFAANAYSRIQLAARLESHYTETIEALVSALEARDPATEAHTGRIRDIATAVAVALRVPSEVLRAVKLGAILHDVGKIGISDAILGKPGALTPEEWAVMRTHPEIGERMLRGIAFLENVLPVVRHHHERWDGGGYPDGLGGNDIPLAARIVSVCDAFDAMTSDRPYRGAVPADAAGREVLACAGSQFDPDCARILVEVVGQIDGDTDLVGKFVRYAS